MNHHPLDNNDPRVVILDRGYYTTCTIILKGASITSWRIENVEQLFISRIAYLDDYNDYLAGVTVMFPHFEDWKFGRDDGFAKDLMWSLRQTPYFDKYGDVHAEFGLLSNSYTRACWNFDFELRYRVTLKSTELETSMEVINPSPISTFQFQFAFHWHLKVKDISKVTLGDVKDLLFIDKENRVRIDSYPTHAYQISSGSTNVRFHGTPNVLIINNHGEKRVIKITKSNLRDLKLWKPAADYNMEHLDVDETLYFAVIDLGIMFGKEKLAPQSSWTGTQKFEMIRSGKPEPKFSHFLDFFQHVC